MSQASESPLQTYACLPADILFVDAPIVYANDYDGVLGKTGELPKEGSTETDGAMGLLLAVVGSGKYPIGSGVIVEAWRHANDSGGSFDTLGYVEDNLPEEYHERLYEEYRANQYGIPLLYPDALPYLDGLNANIIANFTLTHGSIPWQTLKTVTSGIPGHVEITRQKKKGPVISDMRTESGTFDFVATTDSGEPLAVVCTKKVRLADDKAVSHEESPDGCDGYLVERLGETKKKSQKGTVDSLRVSTIHSLGEITITGDMRPTLDARGAAIMGYVTRYVPLASFLER